MLKPSLDNLLACCGRDLTALARTGQLKRAYDRDRATRTLLRILAGDVRHNLVVSGPARAGKTALVHEAVRRLAAGDGPATLRDKRVFEVTPESIVDGLGFGEGWQTNLAHLLDEIRARGEPILFLRDAPQAALPGIGADLPSFLGPYLVRGDLHWIVESLDWRLRDLFNHHPRWGPALVLLPLDAGTPEEARRILDDVCEDVYLLRNIMVDEAARDAIVEMCERFVPGQAFPGKAIDLLEYTLGVADEASGERHISASDVYRCFGERTGLNRLFLDPAITFREAPVRQYLAEYVLGQEPAIGAVVRALTRMHDDPGRPPGVLLFVGPVGVGKIELARTLARFLFGSADRLVCLDMADYAGADDVAALLGDPDDQAPEVARRGQLAVCLEAIGGLGVALLDDFEKAHPLVQARFLALCDDRQFINAMGEPVDLHNVLFVFASNVTPDQPGGFLVSTEEGERFIAQVQRHAESLLSSATLRCVDDICPFQPLRRGDGRGIAFRQVREFLARVGLPSSRIEVEIEDEVIELALEQGYSVQQGARMLGQQIENLLGMPVRQALAARPSTSDNLLRLYVRQGQVEAAFAPLDDAALTSQAELDHWTLDHVQATIPALEGRIATLEERDQVDEAQSRVDDLLRILGRSDFWEDEGTASQQLAELERLSRRVERARALRRLLGEVKSLAAEAQGGRDRELVWQALRAYAGLEHDLDAAELESCLTGPWDHRDAILLIRPEGESPAGPAWALDMARVILDWTRLHQVDGLEALVWDETRGANGPQSIVIQVRGEGAFGLLKGETGTHRLAQSRQDGATRVREVLHARVTVLPAWSDDELVTVPPQECFVQGRPLRASGELLPRLRSQVVAVHQPSETELTFTSDLAQAEAESRALWLLRAMLTAREAGLLAPESQPVWGTVVRTYDQYRTNQVRDHRTGHVVQDMRRVLEGHIDEFLQAYLRQQANLASQTP